MLFNSFSFILLLIPTLFIYYLPFFKKFQILVLFTASAIFYAANNNFEILLCSIAINVISAYIIYINKNKAIKFTCLCVGISINLLLLSYFKYGQLLYKTFYDNFEFLNFFKNISLPVGISFFTFSGISLVVDSYRGEIANNRYDPSIRSLLKMIFDMVFYILFFPKLLAGPIEKFKNFVPQIGTKNINDINFEYCFCTIISGYFFKMVVADNLKEHTFWIEYPYFLGRSSIDLLTMVFGYSMQIFADFAGYSLIAIGIAALFGYQLQINFNCPYISKSFSEFWQRWHISLSSFLKHYLYIPLGGNRKGGIRTYQNLIIVMLLGGLWHGAAWSFALWGGFHGIALAIERMFRDRAGTRHSAALNCIKILVVFVFVSFAWLFFKLPEFSHVLMYIKAIGNNIHVNSFVNIEIYISLYSIPVILYHFYYYYREKMSFVRTYRPLIYAIMIFMIITNSGSSDSFVYFQF